MNKKRTQIVKQLLLLGAFLQREAGRLLADFGLNQQQFVVLKEIDELGPISQRDICSALLFEKSNVSKIVRKLEKAGLIGVTGSPDDSRVTLLGLTAKGAKVVRLCMARLDQWNQDWLKSLSDNDVRQAASTLEKLSIRVQ